MNKHFFLTLTTVATVVFTMLFGFVSGTIAAPPATATLIAPNGSVTNNPPVFRWNSVSDADYYRLWAGTADNPLWDQWYEASRICNGSECSVTPDFVFPEANHTFWVLCYGNNEYGSWSQGMNFSIEAEQSDSTQNDATSNVWQSISLVSEMSVAPINEYTVVDISEKGIPETAASLYLELYVLYNIQGDASDKSYRFNLAITDSNGQNMRDLYGYVPANSASYTAPEKIYVWWPVPEDKKLKYMLTGDGDFAEASRLKITVLGWN